MRTILSKCYLVVIVFLSGTLQAQLVDKTPAAIPQAPAVYNAEPWQDPHVSGINREPSRATAYSFPTINEALQGNRSKARMR